MSSHYGAIISLGLLAGCGGGSGGGVAASPAVRPTASNTLRIFVSGEHQ